MKRLFALLLTAAAYALAPAQTSVTFSPSSQQACTAACATAFTPPAVVLSGLPDKLTTATKASITSAVTPAGAKLWCRRDVYAPGPCPNPFILGASTPLAAGVHSVDYYVSETAPDPTKPTASYQWAISAVAVPPPVVIPPPVTPPTGALASLPYPVATAMQPQSSPTYQDGASISGGDGIVRLQKVADPGGSGQPVYLHRIVRADHSNGSVSVRSEKLWIDQQYLKPGGEYWLSFAFRPKSGEWPAQGSSSDDSFLVFQTHSESNGDTQPPIQLNVDTGTGQLKWRTSYGSATQATSPTNNYVLNAQALPAVDVWRKYVVHIKPGWTTSQNPLTEVWESVGAGAFVKLFSSTNPNDYNWNTGTYPRIGMYKWAGTNWQSGYPTIACYLSTLYFGQGANQYDAAVAAVAAFK